jgi:tetratricopeptide (TPR) repeat protein/predicted aspartyl protease
MRRIFYVLVFALSLASGAWADCKVELEALPVTMAGKQPLISGKINGQPVRFLADSGAFYSLLSPAVAAELKLPLRAAPFGLSIVGVGGEASVSVTTVRKLDIDRAAISDVEFIVGGGEAGHDTAGVLGQNLWHLRDVEYDLANGVIRIVRPKDCGSRSLAYWAKPDALSIIDLDRPSARGVFTYGFARVNGVKIRVLFDSGASSSFLSFAAARRAGIDPEGPGTEAGGASLGVGRKLVRTRIAPVDSFEIGAEKILHTHLVLGDTSLMDEDMLLGADFFLSHRIYVANGQEKIYFTYNGGPVFALNPRGAAAKTAATKPSASPPDAAPLGVAASDDASEIGRRGAAELGRLEYGAAITDLTRAHELAPKEPLYLYQRSQAYVQNRQAGLALADLGDALLLDPNYADALVARAQLRLAEHAPSMAIADLDAAARTLPPQSDTRFLLGGLYERADQFGPASAAFETWIKAHPDDAKLATALNGRCWTGTLEGRDLPAALRACEAALRRYPKSAQFLDSRGLAHLRLGDLDKAIADYDSALAIDPKLAWSLYGRGLAELKQGKTNQASADMTAATAIAPKIAERWRHLGLTP